MKKTIFLTLILTLLLAACGGSAETASTDTQFDPGTQELPLSTQLAIGTLKLEETDQAIASDQAAELLPLWQVLNSLISSDSAAPEEITAITEQIQETMTPEQLATIKEMGLTGQDIFASMQELGITTGRPNTEGGQQPSTGFGGGQGPDGGGRPGGGGGNGFGGQDLSPEQIATAQARRAENGGGMNTRMLAPLTQAVIDLLESKAQ